MRSHLYLFSCLLLLCFTGSSFAAFIAPGSLSPGDTFHWVFATSTTRNATSTDINVYNTFVNDAADASGQAVTGVVGVSFLGDIAWKAIGSTTTVHATTNIGTVNSAVYNLANLLVSATGKAGMFDGGINNPININELGAAAPTYVWTGTNPSGFRTPNSPVAGRHPLGAVVSVPSGTRTGRTAATNSQWTEFSAATRTNLFGMYAISEELTVADPSSPIPAPGALMLTITGAMTLLNAYRRRRFV